MTAISRKVCQAMASKLKAKRPSIEGPVDTYWLSLTWSVSQAFWEQGTGFNRLKFLKACGWTDDDVAHYSHLF